MTLGDKIKFLRENKGLNLSELAKKAGVAKSTLFKIEENKTNPTINTIWAIADVLGVAFGELVGEGEIKSDGVSVVLIEKTDRFESYKMTLKEGAEYIAKPHFPGSKEKIYVLKGGVMAGSIDNPEKAEEGDLIEFGADKTHIYKAAVKSTLIVTIFYPEKRYFKEDVFIDVFDEKEYKRLNGLVSSGVAIIRVIAKEDKYDAGNVIKNENGIFIFNKNMKTDVSGTLSIREYERKVILKHFRKELVYAAYLALIGEVEAAKALVLNSEFTDIKKALNGKN
ncbi:hypothetical protein C3L23_00605 [Nautilia sp. PV-1]|uniref:helix-turn-helix domain-containing protein n=1 Tax=Nautilia sp. PV-1 TaxID=2579250 RepID=UPI000FD738EC|nr:helix-turn-helix transcriptional regulator [Nautilia sp. PV-1]AZV45827.1 hypothetical protein C3L23_00605 [Nautilia sp. PV-1]